MTKWGVFMNGVLEPYDFETEEDAEEHADYMRSCEKLGREIILASNPWDEVDDDAEIEVREID